MNSPFRSAHPITARLIALAMNSTGGKQPVSIRSKSPANSGNEPGSTIHAILRPGRIEVEYVVKAEPFYLNPPPGRAARPKSACAPGSNV
jgi:hypothetical protein